MLIKEIERAFPSSAKEANFTINGQTITLKEKTLTFIGFPFEGESVENDALPEGIEVLSADSECRRIAEALKARDVVFTSLRVVTSDDKIYTETM